MACIGLVKLLSLFHRNETSLNKEIHIMITKEVFLDEVLYQVEIEEIDRLHFWSQQIAVARAYAKAHDICHYPLLQRLANPVPVKMQDNISKTLCKLWAIAFK